MLINPQSPSLGLINPSTLSTDTAQQDENLVNPAAAYGAKQQANDLKALAMQQKLSQQLLGYGHNAFPQLDMSPSANWGEGLAKGLGNAMSIHQHQEQQRQAKAQDMAISDMMAGIQKKAADSAQAEAEQERQRTQHVSTWLDNQQFKGADGKIHTGKEYGMGDLYLNDPSFQKHIGQQLAQHLSELTTAAILAKEKAFGTTIGTGAGKLDNVTANQQYLEEHGANPANADKGQLTPSQVNLTRQVTSEAPVDKLGAIDRQNESWKKASEAQSAATDLKTHGAQNVANLTSTNLNNQHQQLQNQFDKDTFQLREQIKNLEAQGKNVEVTGQAESLANKQAALRTMEMVEQQRAQGKELTTQDAARLDRMMKTAGIETNYLETIKSIQNPKSGSTLKDTPGKSGWVTLPSGKLYNPVTHQVKSSSKGSK